jgi:hypothetical protein
VSKLDKSKKIREEHPLNIEFIDSVFEVIKIDIFIEVNDEQP